MFLFYAVLLTACHRPNVEMRYATSLRQSSELLAIDSMMWTLPDSALTCLLSCYDTVEDRHYANLLLAELLYKNYYEQINRAELLEAVAYYDSVSCPFLAARSHYINGVGYYEHDSVVPACVEYLKAAEIMEESFSKEDLVGQKAQFMALTYTHLCALFSNQYLHEQAIYLGKQAVFYYDQYDATPWHKAWILDEIGLQYALTKRLDSASFYCDRAIMFLPDTNNQSYRDISALCTVLSYNKGETSQETLKRLRYLFFMAESSQEQLARCLNISEIYFHEKKYDSAWVYLIKVFNESTNINSRKQAAEWLVEICKFQGKNPEIYADFLIPFANKEENKSAIKSQLTELYNAFRQKKLELQHRLLIRRATIQTMVVIGVLLIVILFILLISFHRKQNYKTKLETEEYVHKMKQKALAGRLKTSNNALRDAQHEIKKQKLNSVFSKSSNHNSSEHRSYEAFMQSMICQEITTMVDRLHSDKRKTLKTNIDVLDYKDFALSATQITSLTKTVDNSFPNFYSTIKALYPHLSRNEWLHCCLYLMKLDKMSICVLLQEPYYTCRRYTLKMEKTFDCRHGLSFFLIEKAESC